jgi:hypothetical protein
VILRHVQRVDVDVDLGRWDVVPRVEPERLTLEDMDLVAGRVVPMRDDAVGVLAVDLVCPSEVSALRHFACDTAFVDDGLNFVRVWFLHV